MIGGSAVIHKRLRDTRGIDAVDTSLRAPASGPGPSYNCRAKGGAGMTERLQLSHLDLNLLVALDALRAECSITGAGRRIHLTQSAMSGALGRLREYFSDELLTPVGRKMVRTALGERLAEPVRAVLLQIKETINLAPSFDPATSSRTFSLMMSDYVSTILMPAVLRQAQSVAPGVRFEILSNDFSHPMEILERADIDFVIMPNFYLHKSHPSAPLFSDNYVCVVWDENSLVGAEVATEQYLQLGHISVQFGREHAPMVDDFLHAKFGEALRIEVLAMNFNSLIQYVVGTNRISIVHRRLAAYYAGRHPIRLVTPKFAVPTLTESIQWHTCFNDDPGSLWLRNLLVEVARRTAAED
jgi:LysR family transcriptional regulator, nod-box dependent transcriptional activator